MRDSTTYRVLVVDDDDSSLAAVRALLAGDRRFDIIGRARDGREALTLAASLNPDAIIMDVQMPIMNGVDSTRHLRKARSSSRIVVVAAADESAELDEALEAGADAALRRPFSAEELTAALVG